MTDDLEDKDNLLAPLPVSEETEIVPVQQELVSSIPSGPLVVTEPESLVNTGEATEIKCIFDCVERRVKRCFKCKRPFCAGHSAKFSPNFCQDCFKNLQVTLDKYTRVTEDYDSTTDQLITKRESCNQIRIDGPDYVFYTTWINQLNDEELKSVFEFHYFIVKLIEHENETRIVKKKSNLKKAPVPISVTSTTETKTKKVSKPKDMRAELKKLGIPDAVIDQMLSAGMGALSTLPKP